MKENLLHFIWKLQLFSSKKLFTTENEKIYVISPGVENFNAGPDFTNSKIEINAQLWVGNVEIHVKSSDWYVHNHQFDQNYNAVILHVVWEHDIEIYRNSNQKIATLELKHFISPKILENYLQLFHQTKTWIPCEKNIEIVPDFALKHWYERLYFERLECKSEIIKQQLTRTKNDWEAVFFVLLAKNFGLKVNGESFLNIATSFDFSLVRKLSGNLTQLEALFFGQAGLLAEENDFIYFKNLKLEFEYLQTKFKITPFEKSQVQFFRLRPNNFPTIRLSQLAVLYFKHQNLFSKIIEVERLEDFYDIFNVSTSKFWETHFTFNRESRKSTKKITKSFIDLLLLNTIIPIKFMYFKSIGKNDFSAILSLVEHINPEKNTIISMFNNLTIKSENAFETQALLQLKSNYCNKQLCLKCEIGTFILKN